MENMSYKTPGLAIENIVDAVSNWFKVGGFETQILKSPEGGFMIQARQLGTIRAVLGMSSALSVNMIYKDDNLNVEIGAANWAEKASSGAATAAGALATFGFWPAFVTAAYGSWKQSQLPAQVFKAVEEYIGTGAITTTTVPLPKTDLLDKLPFTLKQKTCCPSCGQSVNPNSKFCNQCGSNLKSSCKCGVALRIGARFCDNCGSPISNKPPNQTNDI